MYSFGNVPTLAGQPRLLPGTTHVAIGFVDLGGLAAGVAGWDADKPRLPRPQQEQRVQEGGRGSTKQGGPGCKKDAGLGDLGSDSSSSGSSSSGSGSSGSGSSSSSRVGGDSTLTGAAQCAAAPGALRWVGLEAAPVSVAKALVVAQMLRSGAHVDAVLQVWVSAAWSRATLAAFRASLTAVLASTLAADGTPAADAGAPPSWAQALPPPVQQVLRFWQLQDVPLQVRLALGKTGSEACQAHMPATDVRSEFDDALMSTLQEENCRRPCV